MDESEKRVVDDAVLATLPGCGGLFFTIIACGLLFLAVRGYAPWEAKGILFAIARVPAGLLGLLSLALGIRAFTKKRPRTVEELENQFDDSCRTGYNTGSKLFRRRQK